jgi:hypothetical protein
MGELIFLVERTPKYTVSYKTVLAFYNVAGSYAKFAAAFLRVSMNTILYVDGLLGWWEFQPIYRSSESAGLSV